MIDRATKKIRLVDIIDGLHEGKEVFFKYIRTARDIMTKDVKFLTLDDKISDAVEMMAAHNIGQIPILDEFAPQDPKSKKILVGMVSQQDVSHLLSTGAGTAAETEADQKSLGQSVRSIMTKDMICLPPDAPLFDAAKVMIDEKEDCLLITTEAGEEREVVGVITTIDIIKCFLRMEVLRKARNGDSSREVKPTRLIDFVRSGQSGHPSEILVHDMMGNVTDLMQGRVITIQVDQPLQDAVILMNENRIRHLPVVDEKGQIKGLLSDRDIIRHLPATGQQAQGSRTKDSRNRLSQINPDHPATKSALSDVISSVMTPAPTTIDVNSPLIKAAELFVSHRLSGVPIVSADGDKVVGIMTQTDFLGAILALGRLLFQSSRC